MSPTDDVFTDEDVENAEDRMRQAAADRQSAETALSAGPEQDIEKLRAAAWRLTEAIANKSAADGLAASGHIGWKEQMDADDEFMGALKALRTAVDGRPR